MYTKNAGVYELIINVEVKEFTAENRLEYLFIKKILNDIVKLYFQKCLQNKQRKF